VLAKVVKRRLADTDEALGRLSPGHDAGAGQPSDDCDTTRVLEYVTRFGTRKTR